jgi:hypothetical protein
MKNEEMILAKNGEGVCNIQNKDGFYYPVYSCKSLMSADIKMPEHPCPTEYFFYLDEHMDMDMEDNDIVGDNVNLMKEANVVEEVKVGDKAKAKVFVQQLRAFPIEGIVTEFCDDTKFGHIGLRLFTGDFHACVGQMIYLCKYLNI